MGYLRDLLPPALFCKAALTLGFIILFILFWVSFELVLFFFLLMKLIKLNIYKFF